MSFLLHGKHTPCEKNYQLKQHSNPKNKCKSNKMGEFLKKKINGKENTTFFLKFFNSVKHS
jgi:hypothetical protein